MPIATTQLTDPTPTTKTKQPKIYPQLDLPEIQDVIDMKVTSLSWGQMFRLVGLDPDEVKKASNAELALDIARAMGVPISPPRSSTEPGWYYTANKGFTVRQPKNK